MPTVILNRWDGGIAEDKRTTSINQSEESLNFDLLNEPFRMSPYPNTTDETVSTLPMDDYEIDSVDTCVISGTTYFVGTGKKNSSSAVPTFYTKTDANGTWVYQAEGTSAYVRGSLVVYKDTAYCLSNNGTQYILWRFNSAGSVTNIGNLATTATFYARPFIHPQDDKLYVAVGNKIGVWNNSTFDTSFSLPASNCVITSMTDYSGYLAIVANNSSVPMCYLWGRDTSLTNVQNIIPLGNGRVSIVENLYNSLIFIMSPVTTAGTISKNLLYVKQYSGGNVDTVKTIEIDSIETIRSYKLKNEDSLYFGADNSKSIYRVTKNKNGEIVVLRDKFYLSDGSDIGSFAGISAIGDVFWFGVFDPGTGEYFLKRTRVDFLSESQTFTAPSTYKTTINPNMPIVDRYKDKQIEAFRVSYTGVTSGTLTLKYAVDGSTMTTAVSKSTSAGEYTIEATSQEDGSPFDIKTGRELQFQIETTGGVKIKELAYRYKTKETTL